MENSNQVFPSEIVLTRAQLMCTIPVSFDGYHIIVNTLLDIGCENTSILQNRDLSFVSYLFHNQHDQESLLKNR